MIIDEEFFKDLPREHRLRFAVFCCIKKGADAYEGLAIFHPYFGAVEWFAEFAEQLKKV